MKIINIKIILSFFIVLFYIGKSSAKNVKSSLCDPEKGYKVVQYHLNQNCHGDILILKIPDFKPDEQSLKIFSCLTGADDLSFQVYLYNIPEGIINSLKDEKHHVEAIVDHSAFDDTIAEEVKAKTEKTASSLQKKMTVANSNLGKLKTVLIKVNNNPKCDVHIGQLGTGYSPFIYSEEGLETKHPHRRLYLETPSFGLSSSCTEETQSDTCLQAPLRSK